MSVRLSDATLDQLPPEIARPGYDRSTVQTGVVHLGLGAFHRSHQAVLFDQAIRSGDLRWGVHGASLRSPAVRDALSPQDGLYGVAVREGAADAVRIIGALTGVSVAPEDPAALVETMAAPGVHFVTLTVTEKGYHLDAVSGQLSQDDPAVAADLSPAGLDRPQTAPGFITAALALRRARGQKPFTALSCDNLPRNGERLRATVLAMAARHDPGLRDWIAAEGAFPETMVDRIVPATTQADIAAFAARTSVIDAALVKTEPFLQWVVQDRFCGERPDLQALGVQVTDSVAPWEAAKLRLLNGAHSAIAYLGGLSGCVFVHDFVARPTGRALVERLWDEAATTLSPPPGLDILTYRAQLMARFANPALQHRTHQIAMDGSQKLPQRLLAPIAQRRSRGQPIEALSLAVAAWMMWQGGRDSSGGVVEVNDPLAAITRRAWDSGSDAASRVRALLGTGAIFPGELAQDAVFTDALTRQLVRLGGLGVEDAISALLIDAQDGR